MKINEIKDLNIKGVKLIKFSRFCDHRGYFTEPYRKSDFFDHPDLSDFKGKEFVQVNESLSKPNTVRGLHFQWNPYMGKLVRTVRGRMVDLFLDIRKGSPLFGKISAYDMPARIDADYSEWIWIPPGFAHGNYFTEGSQIEYFCTGEYSQNCEAGISPLAGDIDWSLCPDSLKQEFDLIIKTTDLITQKDRDGFTVDSWTMDERSNYFKYGAL